ncbi:hypothetical protein [Deinococcus sonorensis]|uniref:Uncharacterized protein n=2 Tax=Deinococcus sonorensis TaxID=309891 RepID=A0AAU7UF16_9DEIO
MQLTGSWSDVYGSTLALYQGGAGGHHWAVAARPEQAREAARVLEALPGKGQTLLLVYDHLTPLTAALRLYTDPLQGRPLTGVVVLDRALARGPAVSVPLRTVEQGDLSFQEGGVLPAWTDALGHSGEQGECAAASVAAQLDLAVRVCAPQDLSATLLTWWQATPHALAPGRAQTRTTLPDPAAL